MATGWKLLDLISLNAGERGRQLRLELPIGLLIDEGRCLRVQRQMDDVAAGGKWEILPAASNSLGSVPQSPGVYMFVWYPTLTFCRSKPNQDQRLRFVIYVGMVGDGTSSETLRDRFKKYRKYFGRKSRCPVGTRATIDTSYSTRMLFEPRTVGVLVPCVYQC